MIKEEGGGMKDELGRMKDEIFRRMGYGSVTHAEIGFRASTQFILLKS
jgi:hypothetical protein